MAFGQIELAEFKGMTTFPQKAASAWHAAMNGLTGAGYKPLLFVGTQVVRGNNFWFICEQTLMTRNADRHIVKLCINEYKNVYELVPESIEIIF